MQELPCHLCGAAAVDCGAIFHPREPKVAGVAIDLGGRSYRMFRCKDCSFAFKTPPIDPERLLDCYQAAPDQQWKDADFRHRSFDLIACMAEQYAPGRRALDVGCFAGSLLGFLGDQWHKLGVEPSVNAAAVARARGIEILSPTLETLPLQVDPFDVVFSIDVLEHLPDPRPHLKEISNRLRANGVLIAVTADTSTWPWRMLGSRHWYSSIPEHVSFFNRCCLQRVGAELGLELIVHKVFRHAKLGFVPVAVQTLKNLAYATAVRLHQVIPTPMTRIAWRRAAPTWISCPDHMIVVLQRQPGHPEKG